MGSDGHPGQPPSHLDFWIFCSHKALGRRFRNTVYPMRHDTSSLFQVYTPVLVANQRWLYLIGPNRVRCGGYETASETCHLTALRDLRAGLIRRIGYKVPFSYVTAIKSRYIIGYITEHTLKYFCSGFVTAVGTSNGPPWAGVRRAARRKFSHPLSGFVTAVLYYWARIRDKK